MTRAIYRPPWRIDLDVRDGVRSPVSGSTLARTVASALDEVGAPSPASIGLVLTDDPEIAVLNASHMGKRGPTDVLSFPLLPPSAFARGASAPAVPRPPGTRIHLGDIVVSVERAIEQAETGRGGQTGDVRWSAAQELRLLVTHGVLHICGWDHASPDEEAAMRDVERRLLGAGLGR
ncbi:MAG TPA: rRNA maturation RNase YbeY [Candidatus Limnocylindrales bacterium]|nr:rRNA maturation RNase YbeY [Candidatus Limnocylindrales bacterium]